MQNKNTKNQKLKIITVFVYHVTRLQLTRPPARENVYFLDYTPRPPRLPSMRFYRNQHSDVATGNSVNLKCVQVTFGSLSASVPGV